VKQFKQQMEQHRNNNDNKAINKANTREPPEGSWWMKVPMSCVSLRAYIWAAQIDILQQWLVKVDTAPEIIASFIPVLLHHASSSFEPFATFSC